MPMQRFSLAAVSLTVAVLAMFSVTQRALAQDDWQAGGGPAWQRTLDAARAEGKVVIAVSNSGLARPMAAAFERATGIKAEFLTGVFADIFAREAREARAHHVTLDVIISGGSELLFLREGLLEPVRPQLMLPQVTGSKYWTDGKIRWLDDAHEYLFEASNWVHGWPLINTSLVDPKMLHSWKDLMQPKFKGKIASEDPSHGGPGGQAAASYLASTFGMDFVKNLYIGQKVTYTRDPRQLVEWVARGTYAVALGAVQGPVEEFLSQGITQLDVPYLADGPGDLIGGFSVLKQLKGAPHPNAARVFMNWYASRPGQEVYSRVTLEPSTRTDVKVAAVPAYVIPRPGVHYPDFYKEDWYVNTRPKVAAAIVQALGGQ